MSDQLRARISTKQNRLETGTHRTHHHMGVYRGDPQPRKCVCKVRRSGWSRGYHDQGDTKDG